MKITTRDVLTGCAVPLPEFIEVVFGEGYGSVTVMVRDGKVEIRSDGPLSVEPRAANVIWVSGQ